MWFLHFEWCGTKKENKQKRKTRRRRGLLGGQKQTHIKSDYPRNEELRSMNLGGADKVITEYTTDIYSECMMNDIISFKTLSVSSHSLSRRLSRLLVFASLVQGSSTCPIMRYWVPSIPNNILRLKRCRA